MTAVKDLILTASTLSSPNAVRDHLNNLNAGGGVGEDKTFHGPFHSSILQSTSSEIVETLQSNISSNQLNSEIMTFTESKVTK